MISLKRKIAFFFMMFRNIDELNVLEFSELVWLLQYKNVKNVRYRGVSFKVLIKSYANSAVLEMEKRSLGAKYIIFDCGVLIIFGNNVDRVGIEEFNDFVGSLALGEI